MIKNILIGAVIGVSNVVPGVSGGTMAVILKVYDKLIYSISNLKHDFKNSVKFLAPICIGGGLGIVLFTKVITFLLANFGVATNLVFMAIILGSMPFVLNKISRKKINILISICSGGAVVLLDILAKTLDISPSIIDTIDFKAGVIIFICAVISAGCMIIPGVSGSLVMLILGIYPTITTAISEFNISILLIFAFGAVVGIILCSNFINKLFIKNSSETYSAIFGLMFASMYLLIPKNVSDFNIEVIIGIILAILTSIIVFKFSKE